MLGAQPRRRTWLKANPRQLPAEDQPSAPAKMLCKHHDMKPEHPLFGKDTLADIIQRRPTEFSLEEVCGDIPFWFLNRFDVWGIGTKDLRVSEVKGSVYQAKGVTGGAVTRISNQLKQINGEASADFDVNVKVIGDIGGSVK